jgi:S1-C subfamily serine protease
MFKGQCSGVVVADGLMLTAAHCFDPELVSLDEVVKMDREKDLLLVKVPLGCPCAPLASTEPQVDDIMRVVGFPLARSVQYVTEGRVQSPSVSEAPHYMAISAPIVFGNSGGGAFNARGELIGIVSAVAVYAAGFDGIPFIVPHMGLVVNSQTIKEFLER